MCVVNIINKNLYIKTGITLAGKCSCQSNLITSLPHSPDEAEFYFLTVFLLTLAVTVFLLSELLHVQMICNEKRHNNHNVHPLTHKYSNPFIFVQFLTYFHVVENGRLFRFI